MSSRVVATFALVATLAHAEPAWVALPLEGGHVTALAVDPRAPDVVMLGADEGGIWRSMDGGGSWESRSNGLTASSIAVVRADLSVASRWWAATNLGLFRSDDDGAQWVRVDTGLTGPGSALTTLVLDGNALYVSSNVSTTGTNATVRRSADQGMTWQVLTIPVMDTVNGFAARGMFLLAATWSGLWVSTDGGMNWTQSMTGLPSSLIDGVFLDPQDPDTVYATTTLGLAISTDRAMNFAAAAGGLPTARLEQLAVTSAGLFASTGLELYRSADRGMTWTASPVNAGRTVLAVASADATRVFAGTRGFGVFASSNAGSAWATSNNGLTATLVTAIAVDRNAPDVVLAGTRTSGAFRSADRGSSFVRMLESEAPLSSVDTLWLEGTSAWAVVNTPATASGKLLQSSDRGASWNENTNGLPGGPYRAFLATPSRTLINECFGAIFASDGTGSGFTALNAAPDGGACISAFASSGAHLFASSGAGAPNDGVLISLDDGTSWSSSRSGLPAGAIPGPMALGADGRLLLGVSGSGGGLYASSDDGASWTSVPGLIGDVRILLVDAQRDVIYAATSASLYASPDRGVTWNAIDFGLPTIDVSALALGNGPDLLFTGTRAAGLWVYRDPDQPPMVPGGGTGSGAGGVLGGCGCSSSEALLALAVLAWFRSTRGSARAPTPRTDSARAARRRCS